MQERQSVYFEDHIIYKKPHTQSLHLVLLLYGKTSSLFLPNETVPSDPLPAQHISRAFMSLHYSFSQQVMAHKAFIMTGPQARVHTSPNGLDPNEGPKKTRKGNIKEKGRKLFSRLP